MLPAADNQKHFRNVEGLTTAKGLLTPVGGVTENKQKGKVKNKMD